MNWNSSQVPRGCARASFCCMWLFCESWFSYVFIPSDFFYIFVYLYDNIVIELWWWWLWYRFIMESDWGVICQHARHFFRQAPARAPFGDSLRPSDWSRAKYTPPIGYHINILYFDWLSWKPLSTNHIFESIWNTFMVIIYKMAECAPSHRYTICHLKL